MEYMESLMQTEIERGLLMAEHFENCINRIERGNRYAISCVKGLWSVDAPTRERAETDAYHYWRQYESDGEYRDIE